ncbi:MAG TPA: PAS domain S-box protein [candidate division Zixibacteria bacterium]|nr:PAS domain S-box protein [candidate division Zixibacteria bacterium]
MHQTSGSTAIDILSFAIDNIPYGVVAADLDGRLLVFNKAAERMLGISAADMDSAKSSLLKGCYFPDKLTPYSSDRFPLVKAIQGDKIDDELIYIKNQANPSGLWIIISGRPLKDEDGFLRGGMIVFHDVSKQRIAEENPDSISMQMSALIENQQAGVLVEDENRRIQRVNQAFCEMFSISAQQADLIGRDCSEYNWLLAARCHDPEGFIGRINQVMHEKNVVLNEEIRFLDGRSFQRDYIPVFGSSDSHIHIWQYRDITDRQRLRDKMLIYKRLSSALNQTADSVLITDRDGIIEYVNPAFEKTTGFTREEVIGRTPGVLKSGEHGQEFYRKLWTEISAGRPFYCTIKNRKKSGESYWARQTITPMQEREGEITHYVSVLKDITDLIEKKEQEAKLQLARLVQQTFYSTTATVPGYDIAANAFPADETGGDYFDFIETSDGCLVIAIGDVSGHGIGTALFMAEARALTRAFASSCTDPAQILVSLNQLLVQDFKHGEFVTLLVSQLDPGTKKLTYASAGHTPGYLIDKSGGINQTLASTGIPLGIHQDAVYTSSEFRFSDPGSMLLFSTDGLEDSMNSSNEQFGIERAIQYIAYNEDQSARQMIDGIFKTNRAHAGKQPQQDDITMVVLKAL